MDDALLVMPQKHRKEEGSILAHGLRIQAIVAEKLGCQEPVTLRPQSGRGGEARVRFRFSFFTQPRTSAPGVVLAPIQGVSSSPVQPFWKYSLDLYQEVSLHGDSRSHRAVDVE